MHPSHTAGSGNVVFRWRKGRQEVGGWERERAVLLSRVSCRAGGRMRACSKWKFLPGNCCAAVPVTNATAMLGVSQHSACVLWAAVGICDFGLIPSRSQWGESCGHGGIPALVYAELCLHEKHCLAAFWSWDFTSRFYATILQLFFFSRRAAGRPPVWDRRVAVGHRHCSTNCAPGGVPRAAGGPSTQEGSLGAPAVRCPTPVLCCTKEQKAHKGTVLLCAVCNRSRCFFSINAQI